MRQILTLILGLAWYSVSAQLISKPLPVKKKTSQQVRSIERNTLPFWDDFSITEDGLPDVFRINGTDTTRQWGDSTNGVFVNNTLAKNPPSYKAITFDGLNSQGQLHGTGNGLTDRLYSDYLDLSAFTEDDNLLLSFYWQAGGNVEIPDERDSIRLQFFDKNGLGAGIGTWVTLWSQSGSDEINPDIFIQDSVKLTQQFIHDSTQFRFEAYGDQDGPFDAWHLDWIFLNANRSGDDLYYFDRGLTGQLTSPFAPFKSLPTHQILANPDYQNGSQSFQAFNLDNELQPLDYFIEVRNTLDNSLLDIVVSIEGGIGVLSNPDPKRVTNTETVLLGNIDLSQIPAVDSMVIESFAYATTEDDIIGGTDINIRINDTIRTQYLLHDFYAFDDGTAEYAAGTNQQGDQIAVQFWVSEQDTLTHIDMHFPNIAPDSNGERLVLSIFRNLDDPLALRSEDIVIETASVQNEFTSYPLRRPAIVSDTFYIVYEQNVSRYIGIGLDRSNQEASQYIFENVTGVWERNEQIEGALMIRPVFKNVSDYTLGASDVQPSATVYPNPSTGLIVIDGVYHAMEVRDLSGRLLLRETKSEKHDLTELPHGVYLLTLINETSATTQKIVLE